MKKLKESDWCWWFLTIKCLAKAYKAVILSWTITSLLRSMIYSSSLQGKKNPKKTNKTNKKSQKKELNGCHNVWSVILITFFFKWLTMQLSNWCHTSDKNHRAKTAFLMYGSTCTQFSLKYRQIFTDHMLFKTASSILIPPTMNSLSRLDNISQSRSIYRINI